ncbi:MAG: hypothetical protein BWZ06_01556 [Bacteroidetes bacterium ADurb.BinA261]|nr:MAG: hypothetical protein BWZ06_01556 [Bacteroidetes bacterium ADurb.BinA261]
MNISGIFVAGLILKDSTVGCGVFYFFFGKRKIGTMSGYCKKR